MNKFFLFLVFGVTIISLMGCETIKGMGKDLENTGQKIEDVMK